MATMTVEYGKYSPRLISLIEKLDETHIDVFNATEKRKDAVISVYNYAVFESKELNQTEAIDLIRSKLKCSRATIYRYLPSDVKRTYHTKPRKSQSETFMPKNLTLKKGLPKSHEVTDISISYQEKGGTKWHFSKGRIAVQKFRDMTVITLQVMAKWNHLDFIQSLSHGRKHVFDST